jgi:hypothetical protein
MAKKRKHPEPPDNPPLERDLLTDGPNSIFRLIAREKSGPLRFWGTCFEVAPCVALTAKHVITGILQHYSNRQIGTDEEMRRYLASERSLRDRENYTIFVFQVKNATEYVARQVMSFAPSAATDISWLLLQPTEPELNQGLMKLTIDPPQVGTSLRIYGFPGKEAEYLPGDEIHLGDPMFWQTTVAEVSKKSRLFSAPSLELLADELPGGLSGSPVIDAQGIVCAVFSHSLPDPDGPDLGTAALLMNSFACRPLLCPQEAGGLQLSPYAMAKEGRLAVDGIERLTVTDTKLNYLPPSAP